MQRMCSFIVLMSSVLIFNAEANNTNKEKKTHYTLDPCNNIPSLLMQKYQRRGLYNESLSHLVPVLIKCQRPLRQIEG